MNHNLIRANDLIARGIVRNRMGIYRAMEHAGFPQPVRLSRKSVAWVSEEVEAWLAARIAERNDQSQSGDNKPLAA